MRIAAVEDTELFLGPAAAPRQVVRVTLAAGAAAPPVRVRVEGPAVRTPEPVLTGPFAAGEQRVAEVGVHVAAPAPEGSLHRITVVAEHAAGRVTAEGTLRAAATGWTMWMISHFHYDPVWWNTQRGFTELWQRLPDVPGADRLRPPFVRTAFDLVRAHLDAARTDDDYRFVLAETDYLKPFWDVFPDDRADLRRMLRDGRVELVGGMYNEPNTNLTHPESTIRNTAMGVGFQRDVLGGDPRSAWMLDVFGHDPAFPGLMADAGLTSSAWARGPFHHIGAKRHTGDIGRMTLPSEFEWLSPSGRGLLTAYLADHYVAGWDIERAGTLDDALAEAYARFRELRRVAATRNVLLPVGHDHNVPSRWCTEVHREWARRYVWPRFVLGLPRDFFAAVRAERPTLPAQTRDMNPVYAGKDVSYIDTKQAQRAIECLVLDAERLGTLAALLGTRYPAGALDKAWRLLAYGAHHDAVTGTESDQVYLDLLAGWREAYELGAAARRRAVCALAARADTTGPGRAVLVANTLSWPRDGVARIRLDYPVPGPRAVAVSDEEGRHLPAAVEAVARHADGTMAAVTLSVPAEAVPALGYRVWHVAEAGPGDAAGGWAAAAGETIRNDAFEVVADPRRGGALTRILDRRTGRDLLRGGGLGGELTVQDEYPEHPHWGEGPWHLLPKGPGRGLAGEPAEVRAEHSPAGQRLVSVTALDQLRITREVTLWRGAGRIDFRTDVDGSIGRDRLLRVRFDLDLPGARPVCEVGFAAIGRAFGYPEADAAEHLWTLDNPAHNWAGLSATVRLRAPGLQLAAGVAEVISDGDPRALLVALARQGVTATSTRSDGPRYGCLDVDSNLPDLRVVVEDGNAFAAAVLDAAGAGHRAVLAAAGRVLVPAGLPVLIVAADRMDELVADLDDAVIEIPPVAGGAGPGWDGYSAALVNHGTPGFVATPDGSLYLSLMRACTGWPSGVWIDGPRRHTPDGAGFALQHWSHTFRYSLVAGAGDWREAGFVRAGQELNHPLVAEAVAAGPGDLPARAGLGSVDPPGVVLTALQPHGDAVAVRLYEPHGRPARARIRLHGGLADPVTTNVLHEPRPGPGAGTDGADVTVALDPAGIVTVVARPGRPLPTGGEPDTEPVQPVHTRYWLHNKGPAPMGNLPVSVHLDARAPRVTVASGTVAARGRVELVVPAGLRIEPAGPFDYDLAAGEHRHFDLRVTGGAPGHHYLAARIRDPYGQLLEDVAVLTVPPATDGAPPNLDVALGPAGVRLAPGGRAGLDLRLRNPAGGAVRGEAQLLSAYGTWGDTHDDLAVHPWIRGYELPAGGSGTLRFTVRAAPGARPGRSWWALARVVGMGRVAYTAAVALTVAR